MGHPTREEEGKNKWVVGDIYSRIDPQSHYRRHHMVNQCSTGVTLHIGLWIYPSVNDPNSTNWEDRKMRYDIKSKCLSPIVSNKLWNRKMWGLVTAAALQLLNFTEGQRQRARCSETRFSCLFKRKLPKPVVAYRGVMIFTLHEGQARTRLEYQDLGLSTKYTDDS